MLRILERPRPCTYLPAEKASLELCLTPSLSPSEYGELLRRGYRRFGWQLFRPACPHCTACRSLRIASADFALSASERRVMRLNQDVRCELAPASVTRDHVDLYNRYQAFMHRHRGWDSQSHNRSSYHQSFVNGPAGIGYEWRYSLDGRLIGVALMDKAPRAISLVYFFYDPAWRPHSPGTFSVLNQLLYAQQNQIDYSYLGYWVEKCQSLSYKSRFSPHELLDEYVALDQEPVWRRPPHLPGGAKTGFIG
jgi:arginine-tRNA-protein transferase